MYTYAIEIAFYKLEMIKSCKFHNIMILLHMLKAYAYMHTYVYNIHITHTFPVHLCFCNFAK